MKTQQQILAKIAEHEEMINEELKDQITHDSDVSRLEHLKHGRKALLWVLSEQEFIDDDELARKIEYEILCYESTKIY